MCAVAQHGQIGLGELEGGWVLLQQLPRGVQEQQEQGSLARTKRNWDYLTSVSCSPLLPTLSLILRTRSVTKRGSPKHLAPKWSYRTCEEIEQSLCQSSSPVMNVTILICLRSMQSCRRSNQYKLSLYKWGSVKYVFKPILETVL